MSRSLGNCSEGMPRGNGRAVSNISRTESELYSKEREANKLLRKASDLSNKKEAKSEVRQVQLA